MRELNIAGDSPRTSIQSRALRRNSDISQGIRNTYVANTGWDVRPSASAQDAKVFSGTATRCSLKPDFVGRRCPKLRPRFRPSFFNLTIVELLRASAQFKGNTGFVGGFSLQITVRTYCVRGVVFRQLPVVVGCLSRLHVSISSKNRCLFSAKDFLCIRTVGFQREHRISRIANHKWTP